MKKLLALLICILFISTHSVFAQDSEDDFKNVNERKDWSFAISPYAWLAGQATDVGGEKLRQSFNDLTSLTNFGFQTFATARYKRITMTVDGTFAILGSGIENKSLTVDAEINQWIVDSKMGYIVYDRINFEEESIIAGWSLEATLGAKYWSNDINIDYSMLVGGILPIDGSFNDLQKWWDLMVGFKTKFVLSKSVLLSVGGDIGGFGLGNSSKFAWDFIYANTFRVSNLVLVTAGYRTFRYKRVDGIGEEELNTKVSAFGPFIGVSFVF